MKKFISKILLVCILLNLCLFNFDTKVVNALATPSITSPSDGAQLSKGSVTVKWGAITGATYYKIAVLDQTKNSKFINDERCTSTSYTISSSLLTEGHDYKIGVGAYQSDGLGSDWDFSYFSIKAAQVNPTPTSRPTYTPIPATLSAPKISASISGTVNKDTGSITVSWNSVDSSAYYYIAIRKVSTGSSVWTYNGSITGTSYTIGTEVLRNLEDSTNYYIFVTAHKGSLDSAESNRINFTTGAKATVTPTPTPRSTVTPTPTPTYTSIPATLSAPIISASISGTVNKDTGAISVNWNSVDSSAYYYIAIRKLSTGSSVWTYNGSITGTSYTIGTEVLRNLDYSTNYYIFLTAHKGSLGSAESNRINFTTGAKATVTPTPTPRSTVTPTYTSILATLSAPKISASISGTVNKDTGAISVNWNSVDPYAYYYIAIRKVSTGSSVWTYNGSITGTSYTIGSDVLRNLDYSTNYYIYVTAHKGSLDSVESNHINFTTGAKATVTPTPTPTYTPAPATLSAPTISASISGAVNKDTGSISVSWNSVDPSAYYYIAIRKVSTGSSVWTYNGSITGTSYTIETDVLRNLDYSTNYYIFVTAHKGSLDSAESNRISFTTANVTDLPQAPTVMLTSPSDNAQYTVGTPISITATGTNCHHMNTYINGSPNGYTVSGNSFTGSYTPTLAGTYTIFVRGRNTANDTDTGTKTEDSSTVTITVVKAPEINSKTISGIVRNKYTLAPIEGVTVKLNNSPENDPRWIQTTRKDGSYVFSGVGLNTTHNISVTMTGFVWADKSGNIIPVTKVDIGNESVPVPPIELIDTIGKYEISGKVTDSSNSAISNALVYIDTNLPNNLWKLKTDIDGKFHFYGVQKSGYYTVYACKEGYLIDNKPANNVNSDITDMHFTLPRIEIGQEENNFPISDQKSLSVSYKLSNGDIITYIDGNKNWRNNNPGNLKYFKFSKEHGAIGKDFGNFAIFPDYNTGYNALIELLKSDSYSYLTLEAVIYKYAPPSENNTEKYISDLLKNTNMTRATKLSSLSNDMLNVIAKKIEHIEGGVPGKVVKITAPNNSESKNVPEQIVDFIRNQLMKYQKDQEGQKTQSTNTAEDSLRNAVVEKMKEMSNIKWKSKVDIPYWDGGSRKFQEGVIYSGMPYTMNPSSRVTLDKFKSTLTLDNDGIYINNSTTKTYLGDDCSSALANAWGLSTGYGTANYLDMISGKYKNPSVVKLGNYSLDGQSTKVADTEKLKVYEAYKNLKPGDALLVRANGNHHIVLVESVDFTDDSNFANDTITTISQAGLGKGQTTWVTKKFLFTDAFNISYIPIRCTKFSY